MIKDNFILKINKKNLIRNYLFFNSRKKGLIVAPTIKANAYGLGDNEIFKILVKNKCKHFFVATLDEGIKINNLKKNIKIYVLNGIQNYNINLFSKYNLIPIINTTSELKRIIKTNQVFGLNIDTGINRLGITFNHISNSIFKNKNIEIVISHLASADEQRNNYNNLQKKRFAEIKDKFIKKNIIFSLSNSNGAVLSNYFLFDMIRPGIGIYGGNNKNALLNKKIFPVVNLYGKIIQIKDINKGEYIGYNQTFKTNKKIKVAIIGVGYADGVPRQLSNKGKVYYVNDKYKIIGRISMDTFTIDISNSKYNLQVGTFVDIINDRFGIEDFARQCNTISNEVLTSIGKRVKKIYV